MKFLPVFIIIWLCNVLVAHTQEVTQSAQQQLESIAEVLEMDPEDDVWLQQLHYYKNHPLSINKASAEELRSLKLLTDLQIHHLIQYRNKLGKLINIYELQAVPGWDPTIIQRILPFITLEESPDIKETLLNRLKEGRNVLLLSTSRVLESQKGYRTGGGSSYLGSKDHIMFRYQYRYKNLLQFGITGDKDAGEQLFNGSQRTGFDFYTAHLFARQLGMIKALALGDFTVNMGQGLVQWQSLAFSKSAEVINIKRQSPILQPYSSAGEYFFNRGAGITLEKGKLEATMFASLRNMSGNRFTDTVSQLEGVTSIQSSGYHRTLSEIQDRNHVGLTVFGGTLSIVWSNLKISVNGVHNQLSKPLQKRPFAYNLYALHGRKWSNYSVDYSSTHRNIHLYGEAAVNQDGNKAFLQGALISVHSKADVSILYRNIKPGYQSLFGRSFTEQSAVTNENGFYTGITIRPASKYRIDAYTDFYRFPWLRFRVDAPSTGRDYLLQLTYQPHKRLEFYLKYRNEQKNLNEIAPDSVVYTPRPILKHNCRMHIDYAISPIIQLKARAEIVKVGAKDDKEEGFSVFGEGVYKGGAKFSCNLRLHYFKTDGYNSRIYNYESDLLYHYYIPAFFDQGIRYYIRLNYDVDKTFSFWLRWAQTFYNDMEIIGSGLDEINGNKRSELRLQLRVNL